MEQQDGFIPLEDLRDPPEVISAVATERINKFLALRQNQIKNFPVLKQEIEYLELMLDYKSNPLIFNRKFYKQVDKTISLINNTEMSEDLKRVTSKLILEIKQLSPPPPEEACELCCRVQ